MTHRPAAALLAAVLLACTPNTPTEATPMTPLPERDYSYIHATDPLAPTATPTGVVMVAPPTYLVGQQHAAFPDLEPIVGGGMELVYRQGTDHYLARDGALLSTTLDPMGLTPSPPVTLLGGGGVDYRDPSLTVIDGHRYLTYFTGSTANAAEGAMLTVDSGPAVRIDPNYPYAAITAPIVQLPDGRLGAAYYARKPGETKDSAFMAWSTDGGQTWTSNRILNPAVATPEPWIVVDGTRTLFLARWGIDRLAVRISPDSGATWGAITLLSSTAGMTGRPTAYVTTTGVVLVVYREVGTKAARLAYSLDHGVTWVIGQTLFTPPVGSPLGMTYAAMAETAGPVPLVRVVIGMEQPDGTSALYGTYLAVSVR